jgi:hypothetical protein
MPANDERPIPSFVEPWERSAPRLIANVRNGGFIAVAEAAASIAGQQIDYARRPIATDLYATVVIDGPERAWAVTGTHLHAWNLRFDQAHEVGMRKLREMSEEPFARLESGLWKAPWRDDYVAARVSVPEILHRACTDPYVIVVDPRTMYLADPSLSGAYDRLASLLIAAYDAPDRDSEIVSLRVYRVHGTELRVASAPADSVHAGELGKRIRQRRAREYEEERCVWHEHGGLDAPGVYTKLGMFRHTVTRQIVTWSTWTERIADMPQMLPQIDLVAFVLGEPGRDQPTIMVPFDAVVAEPGMLTLLASPLPRWRTGGFPSHEWIRAHGVEPSAFPWTDETAP